MVCLSAHATAPPAPSEGFQALGSLRTYPLTQLRKLCVALRERMLPWGRPAVQAVVRQALYHLGELTDSAEPELSWRAGWDAPGGVLDTLCAELEALVADLEPVSGWLRGGGVRAR